MKYAVGKKSKAISDRSGMAFPYTEMVKDWNGSFVHRSEYEEKHPQLEPSPPPDEPQALFSPRSDRTEPQTVFVGQNVFSVSKPLQGIIQLGTVTVTIS